MRDIDNRPLAREDTSGGDPWRIRTVRPVAMIVAIMSAIILAVPLWLGACSLIEIKPFEAAADGSPSIAPEPIPGPIALAPSMTGTAPPARPSVPAPVRHLTPPPVPPTAVAIPVAALAPCPPGSIAMWSEPDVTGTPVPICRRLPPPR